MNSRRPTNRGDRKRPLVARAFCFYVALFWGIRVALQGVFDVHAHLTAWWLKLGYHGLTLLFVSFTLLYGWATVH